MWYAQGLHFSCGRCSACCRYEAGFVYLSKGDLDKLAKFTNMDNNSFIGAYCRWAECGNGDYVLSLKEKANKDCVFWNNGCAVYEARPLQCVNFPFWENILFSFDAWKLASDGCPGMNKGEFFSKERIDGLIEMNKRENLVKRRKKNDY